MAEYLVKIGTPVGDIREEVFHAEDEGSLRRELEGKDYYIFQVRPRATWRQALPRFGAARVNVEKFLIFNQELVTLLRAGLPLLHSLDILLERMPESTLRGALEDVRKRVRSGESLSEAFSAQGELFPPIYSSSLTAGERSGELDTVLERYVEYVKKLRDIKRKVGQALVYPAILLTLSIAVIGVLMFYAIPQFVGLYRDFGTELPVYTRVVVGTSGFLLANAAWVGLGLLALVIGARLFLVSQTGRMFWDRWKLEIPLLGIVLRKYSISEMTRTLSILLRGGIPLVTALDVAGGAVGNSMVRDRLRHVADKVRQGRPLWESLEEGEFMLDLSLEMIKVGESTGALDIMLFKISEFYDEDIDSRLSTLVTLFEPIMLVFMGIIVIFLLLSMYLPIFNTISAIHA